MIIVGLIQFFIVIYGPNNAMHIEGTDMMVTMCWIINGEITCIISRISNPSKHHNLNITFKEWPITWNTITTLNVGTLSTGANNVQPDLYFVCHSASLFLSFFLHKDREVQSTFFK